MVEAVEYVTKAELAAMNREVNNRLTSFESRMSDSLAVVATIIDHGDRFTHAPESPRR